MLIGTYKIPKKLYKSDISRDVIGIDFGTIECCAAIIRQNGPYIVCLDPPTRMWTIPLFISFDEKIPKCGQIVIDRMRNWAEHTVYDIKRILGKNFEDIIVDPSWPFKISSERSDILIEVKTHEGKEKINAERVAGDLLKNIKKSIEEHENRTLTDVVISVPLAISEKQKSATKKAAEYAGWKNINFIPEPVAAAFAYFSKMDIPNKSIILIFDFGGGNVDICIAKIIGDNLKILTYNGDSYLGGSNFDRLLYDHFASILTNEHGINLTQNNNNKFRLTNKCKEIKHSLSSENDSSLDVSDFSPDRDDFIEITRDEFETMSEDLMVRTKNVILRALSNANLQTNDINYVFQVGGGCRMPMVKKLLMETFPSSDHRCSTCPEEVVAHGAAAYAYYLKGLEENIAYFGIDFKASKIAFSESVQSTIESKNVDVSTTKDLFKEINKYSKSQSGCLCLCLDNSYKNQTRKEIIEMGKENGFLHIEILDSISSKCLAMFLKAKDKLQNDIIILTVCERSLRYIRKMDNLEPILFGSNIFAPDIEPDIILCDSFENEFFANFDKDSYPNTRIQKVEEFCCAEAALMQAHSVFDKNEFFSEEMILDRDVYFGVSEQKVVNLKFKTLPYRKIIRVYNTEKFFIYDDPTEMIIINFRGDTDYIVTIDIDGNGIFTLKYDETSSEGRQNNGKWFEKFIRGQNNPQTYTLPETTPTFDRIIKAVGFDFGTSKCCVATSKRDGIEVVAVENTGGRIMPSYVAFDEKHTKCGQIVVDRLPYKAAYSVFDLKRIIGKEYEFIVPYPDWPFRVLKSGSDVKIECNTWDEMQQQSPEEILSVLLRHIKVKTEEFQGDNVEEVVITVPGTFTQRQINSTFEAACQAGWKNISFLPEPIAALFTYFKKYPPNNFTGCVFDLGGGNLNVWIFKVENGKIVLLNNDGDTCLGGRNFDKALFTYLYARLKRQFNIDMTETKKYKLIKDCLDIKHSLSTQNKHTILIDDYQVDALGSIDISRLKFKAITVDLIIKIKTIINKTLSDINSFHSNVTKIFYVGGASRMPIIIEMLRGMFPECDHICDTCPDEIVAIGAAHYSYYLKDDNINKIEMEEVFSVLSYD